MKATLEQIVNDQNLWDEYVDAQGEEPEAFEAMTLTERVAAVCEMFPDDMTAADKAFALTVKFDAAHGAASELCETETDPTDGTTTLADWMREGNWQNMTPEAIAAEWDALQAE